MKRCLSIEGFRSTSYTAESLSALTSILRKIAIKCDIHVMICAVFHRLWSRGSIFDVVRESVADLILEYLKALKLETKDELLKTQNKIKRYEERRKATVSCQYSTRDGSNPACLNIRSDSLEKGSIRPLCSWTSNSNGSSRGDIWTVYTILPLGEYDLLNGKSVC